MGFRCDQSVIFVKVHGVQTVMQARNLQVVTATFAPRLEIPAIDKAALLDFSQPLIQTIPLPKCEVCVIVPVRNEAATLTSTLDALAYQIDLQGQPFHRDRYEIVLLANNCTDESAAIAHQFAQCHPDLNLHIVERTLPTQEAHIGRVRQMLMHEAYRRLKQIGRKGGIIASTDGDSQVSPTWIAATLQEIACGADAVGGRILLDRAGLSQLEPYARACHLREVGYRSLIAELESYLDPDYYDRAPRHFQHYGASFAVTAEIYDRAGGLPLVRTPEDVALYRALLRVDARFRHSPSVRVTTSARPLGRTEIGLANQLSVWTTMGQQQQPFLVESGAAIMARLRSRHQLRTLWLRVLDGYQPSRSDIQVIACRLGITSDWLQQAMAQPQTFGLLYEKVEQQQQEDAYTKFSSTIPIAQAVQELRTYVYKIRKHIEPRCV